MIRERFLPVGEWIHVGVITEVVTRDLATTPSNSSRIILPGMNRKQGHGGPPSPRPQRHRRLGAQRATRPHRPAELLRKVAAEYVDAIAVAAESVIGSDNLARLDATVESMSTPGTEVPGGRDPVLSMGRAVPVGP